MRRRKPARRASAGQATTEYILLLLLAFMLFQMVRQALGPAVGRLTQIWAQELELRFSRNLHRFR